MLKSRVIPCLDVKDGGVVKGVNFVNLRDAGDPVESAIAYDKAGADELWFSIADFERLLEPDCARLGGAISGRALCDGRLDAKEALARIRRAKA